MGHFEDSKSGTTPSWLKSFAARKKPKLEEPAVAAPGVDESAATCYMAEELLQCMARTVGARIAVTLWGWTAPPARFGAGAKPKPLNPKA